jgi:hypothetical protein
VKRSVSAVVLALCLALTLGAAGCTNSGTRDTTPPSTPTGIIRTTTDNDNTPTFVWDSATDADSGIACYLVSVDSGDWTLVGADTTYTLMSAVSDGSHTFKVKAVDHAGNEGDEGSIAFAIVSSTSSSGIVIRPDGAGDISQNYCGGGAPCGGFEDCANQWQLVNEVNPDYYTTYLEDHLYDSYDLLSLGEPAGVAGLIESVQVTQVTRAWYCPSNKQGNHGADSWCKNVIETHGTTYYSDPFPLPVNTDAGPSGWSTCTSTYYVNPYTGTSWTWDEINALQAGPKLHCQYPAKPWTGTECTQFYVTINVPIN